MSRRGIIRCSLAAVLFGISAPAASQLASDMGAFTLAGLLYLGAAIAVLPFLGTTMPTRRAINRSALRLGIAVVVGGAIGPVLLAAGLAHAPAATASLLLNLELVFTTVLAYFVFKEHVGSRVASGTALVVVAGGVLGWSGNADLRWGAILIAAACLCWGIDNCITANLDELAPAHITLVKGIIAGGANLAIGLALDGPPAGWPILGALVVGGFGYGASITLWVAGARDLGAARGQLVFATAPFVGAAVAWTVLGDDVNTREILSLVIAAIGVSFVLRSGHEHDHRHDLVLHDHEHAHPDDHHRHRHDNTEWGEDARNAGEMHHQHPHQHDVVVHAHLHVPDLHHRHEHAHS